MKPNFISRNLFATEARVLKEQHLKVKVTQPPGDLVIDGIGFGLAAHMDTVAAGIPFDMVYTLDSNTWNDRTTLQLMIRDLRESQF